MVKPFREWRLEAQALNESASSQGQPEPIPNYSQLRLKPLARKVVQAKLGTDDQGGSF